MEQTNENLPTTPSLVSTDAEMGDVHASLLDDIRVAEALIRGKSEEQRIELGRTFHIEMTQHAESHVLHCCAGRSLGRQPSSRLGQRGSQTATSEYLEQRVRGLQLNLDHVPNCSPRCRAQPRRNSDADRRLDEARCSSSRHIAPFPVPTTIPSLDASITVPGSP